MNNTVVAIIAVTIIIVVVAGAWMASRAPAVPAIPSSTALPTTSAVTSGVLLTTTAQAYSASPYITQSQAQTLIGTITSQTTKVYNTPAEIASLSGQLAGNATEVWVASYTNANNQSVMDYVVLSPDAQALYAKMTGSAPSYATFGTQNGMNYEFIKNTTNNNTAGEGLMGWKGDYVTMAFTSRITNISAASLSGLVASDLP